MGACVLAMLALPGAAQAATYQVTSAPFSSETNNSTCTIGPCVTYSGAQNATLSFMTAAPLAANLSGADVSAQITGYTGSDGFTTIDSSDSRARLYQASVTTNGSGAITSANVTIQ
jgi:hypothetical protein